MDLVGSVPINGPEAGWNRFTRRTVDWLISGPVAQPYDIQIQLLHHSLTKKTTLFVVIFAMSLLASVAVFITEQPWAYAWLIAEIIMGIVRIWIQIGFERAEAAGRNGNALAAMAAGLAWGVVVSAASYQCVMSGEWILILLSGICLAGMVGGISSRNAGTPHYGIVLMSLVTLPYTVATFISPLPHLYMVGLQIPFYMFGIVLVLLENYRVLLGLYHAERDNRWLANHDLLTGLPNRTMRNQRFAELLLEHRYNTSPEVPHITVLCLDLDGFKSVNDQFGHAAGDALLVAVAERLRDCVRVDDFLCRVGGDEFVVLMPDVSQAQVETIAARIIERIAAPFDLGLRTHLSVGISIGSACAPSDGLTADELLRAADRAMYQAKRHGKGLFIPHGSTTPTADVVELVPAPDADAIMAHGVSDPPEQEQRRFPLPFRAKSV
jgi:diguanylate cyclase (GGDEF)-like protein